MVKHLVGYKKMRLMLSCLLIVNSGLMAKMHEEKAGKSTDSMKQHAHKEAMAKCNIEGKSGELQSTEDLLGMALRNPQGQKLGDVEELILNDTRQAIEYVILSANDRLYPIPWTAINTGTETYTLDIDTDKLSKAPTIYSLDSDQFKDSALREKSRDYYERQISAVQDKNLAERAVDWAKKTAAEMYDDEPGPLVYTANEIIGYEVQNKQGKDIGELQDIVFDIREGNLAYGLVSFGGVLGVGDKTAAVPWESIQLESTREIAQLDASESTLNNAVLKNGDIQNLSEPQFARQIHQDFGQEPYWEVFGFVAPAGAEDASEMAWRQDSWYNNCFDKSTVQTIRGTIKKVDSFTPEKDAAPGLKLKLKTSDGKTMNVYAGPEQYYKQHDIEFKKGDQISVTGSKTMVGQKNVLMASEIKKADQTLRLRNEQGKPLWKEEMNQQ